MKILISFLITGIMLVNNIGCVRAQNDEKQIVIMLKEFYTSYNSVWARGSKPAILKKELDSLFQKYCTNNLRNEVEKLFQSQGLDHDIFTNDFGTDNESLETMSITKDSTKINDYIISYIVNTEDPSNRKIKQRVTIHIAVAKETEGYKISAVW